MVGKLYTTFESATMLLYCPSMHIRAGGLKVVPGAHLYRSRDLKDSEIPCVEVAIRTHML